MPTRKKQKEKLVKPAPLHPGDTIGIVAPASPIQEGDLEAGCAGLHSLGYETFYLPSIYDADLFFAGSIERRCRELEEMFERDEVRGILCARGGYGTNTLLEHLDLTKIAKHAKIFMGYSDVTTLLTYFYDRLGLVTFHGPMVAKDFALPDHIDERSWKLALSQAEDWDVPTEGVRAISSGRAEGKLYGGCLSMLVASLGTLYEVETDGTILFLEDVNVKPFRIDRMLMQLKLAGKLSGVRGIVFGEMLDCSDESILLKAIGRVLEDLGIPVAFGLKSGHVSGDNVTLPLGVEVALSVGRSVELKILESAVSSGATRRVAGRAKTS